MIKSPTSIVFSPDSNLVVCGIQLEFIFISFLKFVVLFDCSNKEKTELKFLNFATGDVILNSENLHENAIKCLAFSTDNNYLVSLDEKFL